MAHHDDSRHFLHFSLTAAFLFAVLCIVAMVALVARGPAVPEGLASGTQIVVADDAVTEHGAAELSRLPCEQDGAGRCTGKTMM